MGSKLDLRGRRFGRLLVIEECAERKRRSVMWKCQCEYCGSYKELSTAELIQPTLDGCGCKRKKHIKEVNKLYQGTSIRQITEEKNRKNNTSGAKGVYKHKKNGTYIAYITLQRKQYYLGSYMTLEEAKQARKQAEEEMYKPIVESYEKEGKDERI